MSMRKIVLVQQVSGRRHDGTDWPDPGVEHSVPRWEADELVAGGVARYAGDEADEPAVVVAEPADEEKPAPAPAAQASAPAAAAAGKARDDKDPGPSVRRAASSRKS